MRAEKASVALEEVARRSGDKRLLALAADIAKPKSVKTAFEPVIKAIDKMIKQLQDEENKDLDIKQTCEKDRMADTREAIVTSRTIDEMTDKITELGNHIADCRKKIEELEAEKKENRDALDKAQKMRDDEKKTW